MTVISQSFEQGFSAFEISVQLREDCLLKAARVYMVFEILEKSGEIIKSVPKVERLENEDFNETFTVALITKEDADVLKAKVMKVSEIESVTVIPVTNDYLMRDKDDEIAETTEAITPISLEADAEKGSNDQKGKRNSGVQSGNKTIRVNIDRLDILMNLFEELVIDRGRLQSIASEIHNPELTETVERMTRVSGDLQNIILNMRMIPVETVFNRFPKMVRQLARDLR